MTDLRALARLMQIGAVFSGVLAGALVISALRHCTRGRRARASGR